MPKIPAKKYTASNYKVELLEVVKKSTLKLKVHFEDNYYYIVSPSFKGNRGISAPGSSFDKMKYSDAESILYEKLKKNDLDVKEQNEVLELLALEYKIHLTPKPDFIVEVFSLILQALEKDVELQNCICSLKLRSQPVSVEEARINAFQGVPQSQLILLLGLGKPTATKALNKLYEIFSIYHLQDIGLGAYSWQHRVVNELISFSEGNAELRKIITDPKTKSLVPKYETFYKEHLKLKNPAVRDLNLLHFVLDQVHNCSTKIIEATIQSSGDERCALPHVRLWCYITAKPNHPNRLLAMDDVFVNGCMDNIFQPFKIVIHSFGKEKGDYFLRILLPFDLEIIRGKSFHDDFMNLARQHFRGALDSSSNSNNSSNSSSSSNFSSSRSSNTVHDHTSYSSNTSNSSTVYSSSSSNSNNTLHSVNKRKSEVALDLKEVIEKEKSSGKDAEIQQKIKKIKMS